jgi:hypothetical protein
VDEDIAALPNRSPPTNIPAPSSRPPQNLGLPSFTKSVRTFGPFRKENQSDLSRKEAVKLKDAAHANPSELRTKDFFFFSEA